MTEAVGPVNRWAARIRSSPLALRLAKGAFWSTASAVVHGTERLADGRPAGHGGIWHQRDCGVGDGSVYDAGHAGGGTEVGGNGLHVGHGGGAVRDLAGVSCGAAASGQAQWDTVQPA